LLRRFAPRNDGKGARRAGRRGETAGAYQAAPKDGEADERQAAPRWGMAQPRHCERSEAIQPAFPAALAFRKADPPPATKPLSGVFCALCLFLLFALPVNAATEKEKTQEVKEIRAGQAREKARGDEVRRLSREPADKKPASGQPERDPFDDSPASETAAEPGKRRIPIRAPDDAIFRNLKLKALVRAENSGVAQLLNGRDLVLLYTGDEIALDGRRYKVEILSDGVKFTEQLPESEKQEATEGEPPRKPHTGWVR
jgi:hypothetical protein